MGLDSFVTAKRYLWDVVGCDDNKIAETVSQHFPEMAGYRIQKVETEVMYWRKANAIHRWFVDNVQDGVDECQESYIEPEKLYELRDICCAVLEDRSQAAVLLPVQNGFFFGNTAYDGYYYKNIERTLKWLNGLLFKDAFDEKFKNWKFYYRASW